MNRILFNINDVLFEKINGLSGHHQALDKIMIFLANNAILALPLFLLFLWFKKAKGKEDKLKALIILTSALFGWSLAVAIGFFYFHPRPSMIGLGQSLVYHVPDSSFPSDHVTVLAAAAFMLFSLKDRAIGIALLILSVLVGFARIYCGIHFPFDILGAFAVAFLGASIITMRQENLTKTYSAFIAAYCKIVT